jgi:hypothetical protein
MKERGDFLMGKIRGTGWLGINEYFVNTYGKDRVDRVISTLSPEDQAALTELILTISWVDLGAYIHFLLAADRILGKGDYELIKKANAYSANKDIRGIYKIFTNFVSPKFIIRNAGKLWSRYFDQGTLKLIREDKKGMTLQLTDFPDVPLHHELDQLAFMEECYRISGGKFIEGSHPKCIARGDDCCHFEFTWDEEEEEVKS